MTQSITIHINPVGPAAMGWTQGAGMPGDIHFIFKALNNAPYPNIAAMYPQLVLRPHTAGHMLAYDIAINDPTGAAGIATIPGYTMNDNFQAEVYERDAIGTPLRMLASGRVSINGHSYVSQGPIGAATIPLGPAGPQGVRGPIGEQGARGSRWYTGAGVPGVAPIPDERVIGDMYLDETNGDVWRWDGPAMMWTRFKGA
jgi:hypothetical protein